MRKIWKKGISIMLVMLMVMGGTLGLLVPGGGKAYAADDFALGTGTVSNPYQIATAAELNNVRNHLEAGKNFKLTADIDLSSYPNWVPISSFQGKMDGNGYTITGLTITSNPNGYTGLFAEIYTGSSLTKMKLENVNITGRTNVGGLVGSNSYGTISNSYVSGVVIGTGKGWLTGGLVGDNSGTISNSYSTVDVEGLNNYGLGGLVGNNGGTVNNSFYDSDITEQSDDEGKGVPKTTTEMTNTQSPTYSDPSWDFSDTWGIDSLRHNGYPYLRAI